MAISIALADAQRAQLWDAGFRPVPILNADAEGPSPGKRPLGNDWRQDALKDPPYCLTIPAVSFALNSGILCDGLRPIDIDIDDPEIARRVRAMAVDRFGEAPIRMRQNSARCLILLRAATGTPTKISITGAAHVKDNSLKVEILGAGQQFVAFGRHDSGADLEWFPEAPGEVTADSLPVVTEDAIMAFLEAVALVIGAPPPSKPNGKDHYAATEPQAEPLRIAAAMAALPNAGPADWEAWNLMGMRIWAATGGSPMGGEIFNAWSRLNPAHDQAKTEERWLHYRKSPPTHVGAGSIFHLAGGTFHAITPPEEPPAFFDQIPDQDNPWPEEVAPVEAGDGALRGLPSIQIVAGDLDKLATLGERALVQSGRSIFQRGRELVKPVQQEVPASKGRMTISAGMARITAPGLVDMLCQAATWTRYDGRKKAEVRTDPTDKIANIILSRVGDWIVPVIAGVITTPTIRSDGTVLHQIGYDPATRLFQTRDPGLKPSFIPPNPTKHDAMIALETLSGLLDEFPFVAEVDRSVAVSALMTPVVRGAISVAPLHAIKASTAGTGKSFLADLASAIATGRPCPVISISPDPKETESRLTGLLLAAFPLISLDNVNGDLGGDLLCQAVERPTVRLRRLGGSDIFEVESRATFFATGNGLRVKGDMTRRTILCCLDAGVERPEEREFSHNPVDDVLANRGLYVAACITIARAYIVAGYPEKLRPLASFEEWSDLVRSALVWLGLPDPVLTMDTAREDDPELSSLSNLLASWSAAIGAREITIRECVEIATRKQMTAMGEVDELEYPELHDALVEVASFKGYIDKTRLGRWIKGKEGRIINGLRLKKGSRDTDAKVLRWSVG